VIVSGLNLQSSGSYLCITYGGMSTVCRLVRYIMGFSGIDSFFGLSLFLEFIRSR
jgi:hypothetical protein